MKKIFSLLIILVCASSAFGAGDDFGKAAHKTMVESWKNHQEVCSAACNNFRSDAKFSGYIRSRCLLYQSDRQRLLDAVFPVSAKDKNYILQYPIMKSAMSVSTDKQEIMSMKLIAQEYCKYNANKFTKKNSTACSPESLNSIFK